MRQLGAQGVPTHWGTRRVNGQRIRTAPCSYPEAKLALINESHGPAPRPTVLLARPMIVWSSAAQQATHLVSRVDRGARSQEAAHERLGPFLRSDMQRSAGPWLRAA